MGSSHSTSVEPYMHSVVLSILTLISIGQFKCIDKSTRVSQQCAQRRGCSRFLGMQLCSQIASNVCLYQSHVFGMQTSALASHCGHNAWTGRWSSGTKCQPLWMFIAKQVSLSLLCHTFTLNNVVTKAGREGLSTIVHAFTHTPKKRNFMYEIDNSWWHNYSSMI